MNSSLFIIEAPGKCKGLNKILAQIGYRNSNVIATVGHICGNPSALSPLGITTDFCETLYDIKADKEKLAQQIRDSGHRAKNIFLASDDDQEGDVIARDVQKYCLNPEDWHKTKRVRLKALVPSEVRSAVEAAAPLDELTACKGDARRVLDRLIGALSTKENGAVGRVQGSLLLLLAKTKPLIGTVTYTMLSDDDKGSWTARMPIYAGDDIPSIEDCYVPVTAKVDRSRSLSTSKASRILNHDDILLHSSLETGAGLGEISKSMQSLYEKGRLSYHRAKDRAISGEALKRVSAIAKMNGVVFDEGLLPDSMIRNHQAENAHEAPNPTVLQVSLNQDLHNLNLEEQILTLITRQIIKCGLPVTYERPMSKDIPVKWRDMPWQRQVNQSKTFWPEKEVQVGFNGLNKEQSLLYFACKHDLGRPSTMITHIDKFIGRDLVDPSFRLNKKGLDWHENISKLFSNTNISTLVEQYLEVTKKPVFEMVSELVELCNLSDKIDFSDNTFGMNNYENDRSTDICLE